jgi:lipopolysaccharide transport system permease protein
MIKLLHSGNPFWWGHLPTILWQQKALAWTLVERNLKTRYKGSILGFFWSFANPLMLLGIYVLVFSYYLRLGNEVSNYPAFLISGLFPWMCISLSVQSGTNSIVEGGGYITQTVFQSEILPVVSVLSDMANFVLTVPILLLFLTLLKVYPSSALLALPVLLFVQFLLVTGAILILATYNVFFRDIAYLVTHLLSLVFFALPIIYPQGMIPAGLRFTVKWNPVATLIISYQDIFFFRRPPDWAALGWVAVLSILLILLGNWAFQRHRDVFAEYL